MADISYLLSKALGYGVIVGSTIYKIPQILKIWNGASAQGLALNTFLLETIGFSINLSYNFRNNNPFSTYGENFFMILQNLAIIGLILYFNRIIRSVPLLISFAIGYFILMISVFLGNPFQSSDAVAASSFVLSSDTIKTLQLATIPLFISSRIPQILANFRNKSTGVLSGVTCMAQLGGSLARTFTTLKEVQDGLILLSTLLGVLLNFIVTAQWVYYNFVSKATTSSSANASKSKPATKKE